MKFLLIAFLFFPVLVFGKSLAFIPIGENLTEIYGNNDSNVSLSIVDVSDDGKDILVLLSDSEGEASNKYLKWNVNDGFTSKQNYTPVAIRMGEGFYPNNTIDIVKPAAGNEFIYISDYETINVSNEDIQADFFGRNTNIINPAMIIASRFGKESLTGIIIGPRGQNGRGAFIWNKEDGFVNVNDNDKTNIPICNWDNCFLNIVTGDHVGRGIAGSIQGSPLYMDIKNQTKITLEKHGFERGGITKLSSNGEYALVSYSDFNLTNTFAVYDVNNDTYSILPPMYESHWYFGTQEFSVRLSDVSNDGQLAIGDVVKNSISTSIIWTPLTGPQKLVPYLTSEYGVDFEGWTNLRASHLSSNGQYIYGTGQSPEGYKRIWRLELIRVCESPSW